MKVLKVKSSHKNSNSKKKQSQFSIIFILASQYRSQEENPMPVPLVVHQKFRLGVPWHWTEALATNSPALALARAGWNVY